MIRVVEAKQTCISCPAQWEGRAEDGRIVYARYRWGRLRVSVAPTFEEAVMGGQTLVTVQQGDEFDGFMDPYTLADICAPVLEWPWSRDAR